MTRQNQRKRTNASFTGIRILIALGALASTIGGWASFSRKEEQAPPSQDGLKSSDQATLELTVQLPAMPTLVPDMGVDPQDLPEEPIPTPGNLTLRVVNSPRAAPSSSSNPVARTRSS
jgi:hypothetical protein